MRDSYSSEWILIQTPSGPMRAYVCSTSGAQQALIIVQEAFGVNHHIRELCHRYAQQGFLTIAPELYHRDGEGVEFSYDDFSKVMPTFSKLNNSDILSDLESTLHTLRNQFQIPSTQISVIGYCMGGLAAMILATSSPGFQGRAISYYGGGMVRSRPGFGMSPVLQDLKNLRSPVLLIYGDQDTGIPMDDIKQVEEVLKKHGKDFEILIYPGAGHGFSNDERSSFHPDSAKAAWEKTLDWLCS